MIVTEAIWVSHVHLPDALVNIYMYFEAMKQMSFQQASFTSVMCLFAMRIVSSKVKMNVIC